MAEPVIDRDSTPTILSLSDGRVRTTGETRPTPSGRAAQCYAVVGGSS